MIKDSIIQSQKMIDEKRCPKFHVPFSFKKSCFFLLFFTFFIIISLVVPIACIFIFLKPQMPEFSLQTVKVESYKVNSSSQNLIVSSVLSLIIKAENPNKVGLSFGASRFHVLSQGLVVGLIKIPEFHQPPSSRNVSFQAHASFQCLNVSEILHERNLWKNESSKEIFGVRMLGDIRAQVQLLHINSPKIKVALDCEIGLDPSYVPITSEVYSSKLMQNHMISLPSSPKTVSRKCSLAVLM